MPQLSKPTSDDQRAREWRQRADSARRFVGYLTTVRCPVRVWDLGCGNGWFTAQLAALHHVTAIGVDINTVEVEQARRVFGDRVRLQFRDGDLRDAERFIAEDTRGSSSAAQLDVIVLASTLQYVADAAALLRSLLDAVAPRGEVHVLDTPLYRADDVASARERTRTHYEDLGVAEMVDHYHHHEWSIFAGMPHRVLYRPDALVRQVERRILRRPLSPFPWIRITKQAQR